MGASSFSQDSPLVHWRVIYSSDEHVHSCCVLDVILAETVPSRIMLGHYHDDSSVFLF